MPGRPKNGGDGFLQAQTTLHKGEHPGNGQYLRVHLNNKLDGTDHIAATCRKGQSRLYVLRKLRSFWVQGALLTSFYAPLVASAMFYWVVCWCSSISAAYRKRLDKLIKKASYILGCPLDPVQVVGESSIMDKPSLLLVKESHLLQFTVTALDSSFSERLILGFHHKHICSVMSPPHRRSW